MRQLPLQAWSRSTRVRLWVHVSLGVLCHLLLASSAGCARPAPNVPAVRPPSHVWPQIDVVVVDEASTRRLGGWPLDRAVYATLVDRLTRAGARAIAFDIFFEGAASRPSDDLFAHAIQKSRRTWLIVDATRADAPRPPYAPLATAAGWRLAHSTLVEANHFVGGVPTSAVGLQKYPQLCVGLLTDYLRMRRWPVSTRDGEMMFFGTYSLPLANGNFASNPTDPRRLAIDKESRIRVHSLWKVIHPDCPMAMFRGSVVLVGRASQNHAEELIFDDWNAPRWSFRPHVEALGILLEKMARWLRPPS